MSFSEFKKLFLKEVDEKLIPKLKIKEKTGSMVEIILPETRGCHSAMIRLGKVFENSYNNYAYSCGAVSIKNDIKNDIKEEFGYNVDIDILFVYKGVVYYKESKCNFNLDTEKSIATVEKVKKVIKFLKTKYKTVKGGILSSRYPDKDSIYNIKPSFENVKDTLLFGYKDFFKIFNVDVTEEEWIEFLSKDLGKKLRKAV